MKEIIINNDNLKDTEITQVVERVKILLINSNNEILLGYSNNEYQFPGGHVEDNETLIDTVNREIEEETGIKLNLSNITPFACIIGYYKDWPKVGCNRKTKIYYYEVKTDIKPNLDNTKYTIEEIEGKYELRYLSLDNIENELIKNINIYEDKHGITKEMLQVLDVYKKMR